MKDLVQSATPTIPDGLARIANGRDNLSTNETAYATGAAPQTIRKHICLHGHFHGVTPIRIGSRLYFKVADLANLVRGEQA